MTEYLVIGGFLFWAYMAIVGVLLVVSMANDADVWGMSLIVGGVLGLKWIFAADLGAYFPQTFIGWTLVVVGYLPIGVGWSFFKFYVTYKAAIRRIISGKQSFIDNLKRNKPALTDAEIITQWNKHIDDYAPSAADMKGDIIAWIACWPISVLCYLVGDLLHDLLNWIYDRFSGSYDRIAASIRNSLKDQSR